MEDLLCVLVLSNFTPTRTYNNKKSVLLTIGCDLSLLDGWVCNIDFTSSSFSLGITIGLSCHSKLLESPVPVYHWYVLILFAIQLIMKSLPNFLKCSPCLAKHSLDKSTLKKLVCLYLVEILSNFLLNVLGSSLINGSSLKSYLTGTFTHMMLVCQFSVK